MNVGDITLNDLLEVHPYNDIIETFDLTGAEVIAVLEQAVMNVTLNEAGRIVRGEATGGFLQISGLRYSADATRPAGERVLSVEVLNEAGEYEALDPAAVYRIVGNDYIRKGGEGHTVLAEQSRDCWPTTTATSTLRWTSSAPPARCRPQSRGASPGSTPRWNPTTSASDEGARAAVMTFVRGGSPCYTGRPRHTESHGDD